MQDREYSREKLLITALSELAPDARTRIRKAYRDAVDGLLENTVSAWKPFIEICERRAIAGSSTCGERLAALSAAQRAYRNAKIEAYQLLFDAVAAEYLQIDTDPEAFSDRMTEVVLPLVCRSLPRGDDDRFTLAAIRTRVGQWESRTAEPTSRRPKRERPAQIIDRLKLQKSWTIEHLAEVAELDVKSIYKIKWERPVNSSTIAKLAKALGCHAADLIPVLPPLKNQR